MSQERVVAIAADYADALLVARRAQRTFLLLLLVILLAQVAVFCTAQFAPQLLRASSDAASRPVAANWPDLLRYVTQGSLYLAMIFSTLLALVLFLTIHIMLVGRLIGVAYVTRAFTLAVLLALLLFPWQTILVTGDLARTDAVIPGVLFTWREVSERVPMQGGDIFQKSLYWGRFLAMPLAAIAMLLVVQVRSGRGLKLALGEEELLPFDAEQTTVVATVR